MASDFDILAVFGRIGLCFGYGAWVSAIVHLEHMALSIGLGGPRGPQNDYVHLKPRYIAFLASNFDISAGYGPIGLCFGYDAPVGLCCHISSSSLSSYIFTSNITIETRIWYSQYFT